MDEIPSNRNLDISNNLDTVRLKGWIKIKKMFTWFLMILKLILEFENLFFDNLTSEMENESSNNVIS